MFQILAEQHGHLVLECSPHEDQVDAKLFGDMLGDGALRPTGKLFPENVGSDAASTSRYGRGQQDRVPVA